MPDLPKHVRSGGCQCGALRYALRSEPTHTSICWCRMCQKASGNYFQALNTRENCCDVRRCRRNCSQQRGSTVIIIVTIITMATITGITTLTIRTIIITIITGITGISAQ
jgi:hypothetical protein